MTMGFRFIATGGGLIATLVKCVARRGNPHATHAIGSDPK